MVIGTACRSIVDCGYSADVRRPVPRRENSRDSKRSRYSGAKGECMVSFLLVAKNTIGFRESARLVEIAEQTGCKLRLAAGKKSGSTDSILSIASMMLAPGASFVLTIEGEHPQEAFHAARDVLLERSVP